MDKPPYVEVESKIKKGLESTIKIYMGKKMIDLR